MADTEKTLNDENLLACALNPIGALALSRRVAAASSVEAIALFEPLAPHIAQLLLATDSCALLEVFVSTGVESIFGRIGDCLAGLAWTEMERVLDSPRGAQICHAIVSREHETLANTLIRNVPRTWWPLNGSSLPLLANVIDICGSNEVASLMEDQQLMNSLCESLLGFYCVLRLLESRMDQTEARSALAALVVRAAAEIDGGRPLHDAILYGDVLVDELIQLLCSRVESYECFSTGGLIIRLLTGTNEHVKCRILEALCSPQDSPLIARIRLSPIFATLHNICRNNLSPQQFQRLERSTSGGSAKNPGTKAAPIIAGEASKKRRNETSPESPASAAAAAKKARATSPPPAAGPADDSQPSPPSHTTSIAGGSPSSVAPDADQQPTTAVTPAVAMVSTSVSSTNAVSLSESQLPVATPVKRPAPFYDGEDVTAMAMSEKSWVVLTRLESGSPSFRQTIFDAIRGDLLALTLHERGTLIVQWFIVNGTGTQRGTVEGRVEETLEDLVESGGYGRQRVREIIDRCEDEEKRAEMERRFEKAMAAVRRGEAGASSQSGEEGEIEDAEEELEIVSVVAAPSAPSSASSKIGRQSTAPSSSKLPAAAAAAATPAVPPPPPSAPALPPAALPKPPTEPDDGRPIAERLKLHLDMFAGWVRTGSPASFTPLLTPNSLLVTAALKDYAASQLLRSRLASECSRWMDEERGATIIEQLAANKHTRLLMVHPITISLHSFTSLRGKRIVQVMMSSFLRDVFIKACVLGDHRAPFVRMLEHADTSTIALIIHSVALKNNDYSLPALVLRHARRIASSDSGRDFLHAIRGESANLDQRLREMGVVTAPAAVPSRPVSAPLTRSDAAAAAAAAAATTSSASPAAASAARTSAPPSSFSVPLSPVAAPAANGQLQQQQSVRLPSVSRPSPSFSSTVSKAPIQTQRQQAGQPALASSAAAAAAVPSSNLQQPLSSSAPLGKGNTGSSSVSFTIPRPPPPSRGFNSSSFLLTPLPPPPPPPPKLPHSSASSNAPSSLTSGSNPFRGPTPSPLSNPARPSRSSPWNPPAPRLPLSSSALTPNSFRGSPSSLSTISRPPTDSFRQLCVEKVIECTVDEIVGKVVKKDP